MKKKKCVTIVLRLFFVILIATIASARNVSAETISVKQLGCGAQTNCYASINTAISYAQPDDIIKVYPGRYEEAVVINKNLKLIGSGPQVTFIYSSLDGIKVMENIRAVIIGFTISSAWNGIYLKYYSNSTIKNNCIISSGKNGIFTDSSYSGTSKPLNTFIINNVIAFNALSGIANADYYMSEPTCSISNNIILSNGSYGMFIKWADNISISYNNVIGNYAGNYSGVSADAGDISQNPLFIDSSNGNYTLQSTSPCKKAGRPGSADANPDGTRNDMGVYGGPDAASFWPYPQGAPMITNLTVTPSSVQKGATITINATGEVR